MINKQKHVKTISIALSVLMIALFLVAPASALSYRKGTNSASESYRASEYYEKLTSLTLTGDGRTDLIAVALSQLGYTEGNENGAFGGNENGTDNFTEYNYNMGSFGSGYGGRDYPWCASFVSFCLLQSGNHNQTKISDWCRKNEGDSNYIWREVSCNRWAKQLRTCGYFENSASFGGDYLPIPGDLIYFTEDRKLESHIGIVLFCDGESVYTVEGNTSSASGLETNGGGVYVKSYGISSTYIRGYGVLPYKVNNGISHIDYSGVNPTEGLYVATTEKCIYPTENASTYTHLIPKYSFFEVTEVASGGRLKVRVELGGATVEGYIKNNSDRVIQLSSKEIPTSFEPLEKVWGYKRSCIDSYTVGENSYYTKPSGTSLAISQKISVSGSASLTRDIEKFGYYFDGESDKIVWDEDAILIGESLDVTYKIEASTDSLSAGDHTLHLVLSLADSTLAELDTIDFTAKIGGISAPNAPIFSTFTDSSITLGKYDGYEYKIEGGEWQSTPTFENLSVNTAEPYLFYQRLAETKTNMPSKTSEALSLDLGTIAASTKLVSLNIPEVTLSKDFDSDVTEYEARVPHSVESITPEVTVKDGSSAKIEAPTVLEAGKSNTLKITVTSPYGERVYKVNIFREEEEFSDIETDTNDPAESDSECNLGNESDTEQDLDDVDDVANGSCSSTLLLTPLALIASLSICTAFVKKK